MARMKARDRDPAAFAIKAAFTDLDAASFVLIAHKTMYRGRTIRIGDIAYLFASERAGGHGLFARGAVTVTAAVPPVHDVERQTPRVDVSVAGTVSADRVLGRDELAAFDDWQDGRAETELAFKLYRQATDKIVGITAGCAAFLDGFFPAR